MDKIDLKSHLSSQKIILVYIKMIFKFYKKEMFSLAPFPFPHLDKQNFP
jgi:hypothetical protein